MMRLTCLVIVIELFLSVFSSKGFSQNEQGKIPELMTPVYEKVKDLNLNIPLVIGGKAVCSIVAPSIYSSDAEIIQSAIERKTGIKIPIISDTDTCAKAPFTRNMIILGNRSTSRISAELYDRYYSLMDLKYPGRNGYSVRSLHNPYGNGYSAVLVGGSDPAGVSAGAIAFAGVLDSLSASTNNMTIGWTMLTKLGDGVKVPSDIKDFETWEASKGYGSIGYFGWNSISKRMAMYYMTGDPFHAREAIRLSFPDAQALKEIDEIDGERIENKKDPLAGPYHYNAMMLILFWDMIEESPVFSDSERLKVTNAFARRLTHEGTTPFDKTTYKINAVPRAVGSRHDQWSAMSLYTLGRYFNKYYTSPMWAQAERAGKLAFASLHDHASVVGESDQLSWYCTAIAPVLTYMIMTGDRVPLKNGVLQQLLKGMEVLISGKNPDWALNSAALDFLNKAAYLTGDGRWITYRQKTGLDTGIFRLGQSFWPDHDIKPSLPSNLTNKWLINYMPEEMWRRRSNNFKLEQSFQNMSFRSAPDSSGDYILVKGYNGAYRNPYHTYDIIELRLNGATLLQGFNNQILSSADGMVEPKVAMDGALIHHDVVGQVAAVTGEVPNLPFINWRRSLALRTGQYVLIADDITFRGDNQNSQAKMNVRLETSWEMPGAVWMPKDHFIRINPAGNKIKSEFELHSSEIMDVQPGKVTSMVWKGAAVNGQKRTFFHLIGQKKMEGLANLRLDDHASALALPEAALAVSGKYEAIQGELILLSEKGLYGHALGNVSLGQTILTSDSPVDVDWEFENGKLSVVNSNPVRLSLAISSPGVIVNGKLTNGTNAKDLYNFNLPVGRHLITGAKLSDKATKYLSSALSNLLKKAQLQRRQQLDRDASVKKRSAPVLNTVMKANIGGNPGGCVIIPSAKGDLICTATGKSIFILDSKGGKVRKMTTSGDVKVLHWWAEPKLLLAGCLDEKVFAFDESGQEKWEFTSVMDPAVYEAAKPYWFKSAYPGISGLQSGYFDNGKSRAFVGSACTLEILNEMGQLVKRLPVFWGPGRQFLMVDAANGTKNLLVGRWNNDWSDLVIINNKTMAQVGRGYNEIPAGHSYVGGWDAANRYDNFLADLEGDGKPEVISAINGVWNRITIYTRDGKPLYNAQFGPGIKGPRTNLRMMDIGDLHGDGKQEIIVGLSSGYVTLLDAQAKKIWSKSFSSAPSVVKIIKGSALTWICVGCEDGTVVALNTKGEILKESVIKGKPVDLQILNTSEGTIAIMSADSGEINGFVIGTQNVVN